MLLTLSLACVVDIIKQPVEAPAEIDELSAYLYSNFNGNEEDGDDALPAGLLTLEAYLDTLELDLESDVDNRTVSLSPLTGADLDGTEAADSVDLSVQVGLAVSGLTSLTMEQELSMIMEPNQVCIASDTTAYHAVTTLSGGDCFADECDLMETSNEFLIDSISDGWLDTFKDYRWVTLEDGRQAVVAREWMPTIAPALSGDNSWDQRFAIVVWIPTTDGSETKRYYAMWSSVTTILTDDIYANMVKNGLDEYYANTVAYSNGEDCDNDRARAYDRE